MSRTGGRKAMAEQMYPGYLFHAFLSDRNRYSQGYFNPNTQEWGFYIKCANFWQEGICLKRENKLRRELHEKLIPNPCAACMGQHFEPLEPDRLKRHLMSQDDFFLGVYPAMEDGTISFLTFSFQGQDLNEKALPRARSLVQILEQLKVDYVFEVSQVLHSARVFLFFEEPVTMKRARELGMRILGYGADLVDQPDFISYDAMIPSRDTYREDQFGDVVPMPLEGSAVLNKQAWLADASGNPLEKPWQKIRSLQKISMAKIAEIELQTTHVLDFFSPSWPNSLLKKKEKARETMHAQTLFEVSGQPLEGLETAPKTPEKSSPQKRPIDQLFIPEDVQGTVYLRLASRLGVEKKNLSAAMKNRLRQMAAYANPDYTENERLNYSNYQTRRIISQSDETEEEILLPYGLKEQLTAHLEQAGIPYEIVQETAEGELLHAAFQGILRPQQETALRKLVPYDTGIVESATGSGKTVMGTALIARKNCSALVVVPSREILSGWQRDMKTFLDFSNMDIDQPGVLGSGKNTLTGKVDLAMVQSLQKQNNLEELLSHYGMIIIDECHHSFAKTYQPLFQKSKARYRYGFSATPKRTDQQEPVIYMELGEVRTRFTAKDQAAAQDFARYFKQTECFFVQSQAEKTPLAEAYQLIVDNEERNAMIHEDVKSALQKKRSVLVLTKHREHARKLYELMKDDAEQSVLLVGSMSAAEKKTMKERLDHQDPKKTFLMVGTGSYIGEGFNLPRLDTLMLAAPVSADMLISQYSGRLHREYPGKKEVVIYDYVDMNLPVFVRMAQKRQTAYLKNGYVQL